MSAIDRRVSPWVGLRAVGQAFADLAAPNRGRGAPGSLTGWRHDNASGLVLADLRTLMAVQIARIAAQFGLAVEDDLLHILPLADEDDPSFIPGLEEY